MALDPAPPRGRYDRQLSPGERGARQRERLVLAHIRCLDPGDDADAYARDVIGQIQHGLTPDELGVNLDD